MIANETTIHKRPNKGNSSIPLFKTHKSRYKKQNRGNKTKTEGNALNIRGEQRHNTET